MTQDPIPPNTGSFFTESTWERAGGGVAGDHKGPPVPTPPPSPLRTDDDASTKPTRVSPIPPSIAQETLSPEQAARLLQHQKMLQNEAQIVLKELDLVRLLSAAGILRHLGSSALGLMVWRDLDLTVSSPGLSIERAYEIMYPLYIHPRVKQVRYFNESGSFNPTGLQLHDRYYFAVIYDRPAGDEWKIDVSFWLADGIHPEPVHDAMEQQLTPETRLAILWIKDSWYRLPVYRHEIYSVDIYDAVLQHGVRTPAEFDSYLARQGKPTRAQM